MTADNTEPDVAPEDGQTQTSQTAEAHGTVTPPPAESEDDQDNEGTD